MRRVALTLMLALCGASPVLALDVGQPAPAFSATGVHGGAVTLAGLRGKTVVLEWTNSGCPFSRHMYASGVMQDLQRKAAALGVVWLSVMSSAPGKEGYMTAPEVPGWRAAVGAASADVILDPSGALGHQFDARTTPQIVIIGPASEVLYSGAVDDKPSTKPDDAKAANNYIAQALTALRQGRPILLAATKSYGCAVKY